MADPKACVEKLLKCLGKQEKKKRKGHASSARHQFVGKCMKDPATRAAVIEEQGQIKGDEMGRALMKKCANLWRRKKAEIELLQMKEAREAEQAEAPAKKQRRKKKA